MNLLITMNLLKIT